MENRKLQYILTVSLYIKTRFAADKFCLDRINLAAAFFSVLSSAESARPKTATLPFRHWNTW